jgi:hypothetical protein
MDGFALKKKCREITSECALASTRWMSGLPARMAARTLKRGLNQSAAIRSGKFDSEALKQEHRRDCIEAKKPVAATGKAITEPHLEH